MNQLHITGIVILADCFDTGHPKEDAVNLISAMNNLLTNMSSSPQITFNYQRLRVRVEAFPELEVPNG